MSRDFVADIHAMHEFYGFREKFRSMTMEELARHLKFRFDFLGEEYNEGRDNIDKPEDVVDALIDLIVVAVGTLDAFDVDAYKAWDAVLVANMNKRVGVKPSRPNPLGLPDLIKPEGWVGPSHEGNHGILPTIRHIEED